jgi:hypothetical protein
MEFVIDTFSCAPPPDHYGKLPKDMKELQTMWGAKHTNVRDDDKRAEGPWSIAIYSDDRHCEPELVRQMQHATGADYDDCHDWVRELDSLVSHSLHLSRIALTLRAVELSRPRHHQPSLFSSPTCFSR